MLTLRPLMAFLFAEWIVSLRRLIRIVTEWFEPLVVTPSAAPMDLARRGLQEVLSRPVVEPPEVLAAALREDSAVTYAV